MEWKKCCAETINDLWIEAGGSDGIIMVSGHCPVCGNFIGLTYTKPEEAKEFLEQYGLEYLKKKI